MTLASPCDSESDNPTSCDVWYLRAHEVTASWPRQLKTQNSRTHHRRPWWLNIQHAAEQQQLDDRGEGVTVHIPLSNELTESAVERFRGDRDVLLKQLQKSIAKRDQQGNDNE